MVTKRGMAGASGSVIELSNYLEKRLSAKSAEYAAVSKNEEFYRSVKFDFLPLLVLTS